MSHRRAKRLRKMLKLQGAPDLRKIYLAVKATDRARRQPLPSLKRLHRMGNVQS